MDVGRALVWAERELAQSGIDTARTDAELMLQELLHAKRSDLYLRPDIELLPGQENILAEWVKRRCARMPLQYILHKAWFMDMELYVDERVLIPRPETELLAETVLEKSRDMPKPLAILDIGTGSGAIAIALAKYIDECRIWATDISDGALEVARRNAERYGMQHKITFLQGDLFEPVRGMKFDIIASNPPYIRESDIAELEPEVRMEPRLALSGGYDGLDYYRRLSQAVDLLKDNGFLIFEIGYDQAGAVSEVLRASGLDDIEVKKDLAGLDRMVLAYKNKNNREV